MLDADMLLGADFFLSHRVYMASKQDKIYFTYNGGPVFDLREDQAKAPAQHTVAASSAAVSAVAASNTPLGAAALRRRGTASLGRGDFAAALADFDRAIALDAIDPENFYERGLAHWQNGESPLASADFDAVLKLKPDHLQGLLARGTLRLRMNDESGADADFQEALKLAPKDVSVGLRIADVYLSEGNFVGAILRFDAWISANPRSNEIPFALNNRCWARAMLGKELDLALADCDNSLKKGQRIPRY